MLHCMSLLFKLNSNLPRKKVPITGEKTHKMPNERAMSNYIVYVQSILSLFPRKKDPFSKKEKSSNSAFKIEPFVRIARGGLFGSCVIQCSLSSFFSGFSSSIFAVLFSHACDFV